MIEKTIAQIEAKIRNAPKASEKTKGELLALLGELRGELKALERTHAEDARGITQSARDAADDPTAIERLGESVERFEATHPQLVSLVQRLSNTLSNMGL